MRVRLFGRDYAFAERVLPQPSAVAERPKRADTSEIGFYGSKIFAGIPMEEYNPELTGIEARTVYDRMRRSDGQVQAVLLAMTLPIRSARWFIEPNDDGGREAQDVADFVEANLFGGMKYSFDDFQREGLLHLTFGFSVFEKVWKRAGQQIQLDKYAPRVAPSIWRWPQDENYDVAEVEQINYVTGQMVRIPLWKCRTFTHWREGDNPEGISMLRAAYKHWIIKDALLRIVNVGVERNLVGVPKGTIPKGASAEDISKFQSMVQNLRTDEQAGVTMPEGFLLEILEGHRTAVQALPYVNYQDEQIARSVLAQWMGLGGKAQGGSLALSQDQTDMFLMCVEAEARYFEQEVQRDICELCGYNWGDPRLVPKLKHKDIGYRDMGKFAAAMHDLMGNKVPLLTLDDGLEDRIRDMFGLPEITPEQRKAAQAKQAAAAAGSQQPPDGTDPDPGAGDGKPPAKQPPQKPGDKSKELFTEGRETIRLADGRRWRRDLTAYEHNVQFDALDKQFTAAESELFARMVQVVQKQGEGWISRLESLISANSTNTAALIRAISALDVKLQNQMSSVLRGYMLELLREAAKQAAQEIGSEAPANPSLVQQAAIQARADAVAALATQKLESRLQLVATQAVSTGDSPARVLQAVREVIADAVSANPDLKAAATISVGQAINTGRDTAAMAAQNVQAAQWSAILDKRTCPLCQELDGMVIDIHDPDYNRFQPPIHSGCRCIWVYITGDEQGVERTWQTPGGDLLDAHANLLI